MTDSFCYHARYESPFRTNERVVVAPASVSHLCDCRARCKAYRHRLSQPGEKTAATAPAQARKDARARLFHRRTQKKAAQIPILRAERNTL